MGTVTNLKPTFPASDDAERSILIALMTNSDAHSRIISELTPDDFSVTDYKRIFAIAVNLYSRHEPIDLVTVNLEAQREDTPWGISVTDLFKKEFSADYPLHIKILKDLTRRRRIQTAILDASGNIFSTKDVDVLVSDLITKLTQTSFQFVKHPVSLEHALIAGIKRIYKAHESGENLAGIPTGLNDFDTGYGGFHAGDLIVIGARPSEGKSALLASIAIGSARLGYPSMIVNAEMETEDVAIRMLAGESHLENFNLRRGKVNAEELTKLAHAGVNLSPLPIWIYDDNRWEVIKTQIKAMKIRQPKLSMVLIDYLTRMRVEREYQEKRWEQIGRITKDAKDLGRELGLAIVIAAQLSRDFAKEGREPDLPDLRESGDIEQDVDVVTFLHRFPKKKKESEFNNDPPELVYWLIKKNRNGPTGYVKLKFIKPEVSYYDYNEGF